MRASEPVSCWPHKPREWRSTRQPATSFGGSRSTGGPLACNQPMRVRFPPLPPNLPGRPLRSRRQSEKLDKHVRLVPLAPGVTVAEWLRRATVDRSTRVQFSPVTPFLLGGSQVGKASDFESDHAEVRLLPSQPPFFSCGRRSTDQDTRLRTGRLGGSNPPARAISRPVVQGTGHSPPKAGIPVRPRTGRPDFYGA